MATAAHTQDSPRAKRPIRRRKVDESRRVVSHEQTLQASLTEFAEAGFEETTLAAIGQRLGVTAPLLIYHFATKDNLWRSAVDHGFGELAVVLEDVVEDTRDLDGLGALESCLRRLVYFFATHRDLHRVLVHEACTESERLTWLRETYVDPLTEAVRPLYERAMAEGSVKDMPFAQAVFLMLGAASNFLESRSLRTALYGDERLRPDQLDDYVERLLDFCFGGLRADQSWSQPEPMPLVAVG